MAEAIRVNVVDGPLLWQGADLRLRVAKKPRPKKTDWELGRVDAIVLHGGIRLTEDLSEGFMEQHQHYQSLQDQAYNALRSKIIYAELKPGTRLSAIGLEKETGIGRTPIRESFVRLREQELVETRPKSGTYVSKISMERAENACFLREKLERSVLIKCCSAATPEQKCRLEQILAESESLDHSETRRFFDLDNLFHETCFEIAGRHMLWDWMKSVNTHFERYNWLRMVSQDLDWEPIRRQHRRILEAIKRGDTDAASYLAETHLHLMPEEQGPVIALHPDYFELSKDSFI